LDDSLSAMVAAQLSTLVDWPVEAAHPADVPVLGLTPRAWCRTVSVHPAPQARSWWDVETVVTLAVGITDPARADAAADQALIDLLSAVDDADDALVWTDATRVAVEDTYPGYQITLTARLTPQET
jgi:hypothetical protein